MKYILLFCICIVPGIVSGQESTKPVTLVNNVRIFTGKDAAPFPGNVLITGNIITKISTGPIATDRSMNTTIIDGGGQFLMPGLIDAHYHCMFANVTQVATLSKDYGFVVLMAAMNAREALLRGFTSVRDMGGPIFGLKDAIDAGVTPGPRIWPSGAFISQTGGHGDFRLPYEVPRANNEPLSYTERIKAAAIADGADAVLLRAREQLMAGASQLKLMAGGGVSSMYDPLDVTQYTEAEFHAAVEAAENWGTYVTVHAYTPKAIQVAIKAGVKCIEHGQLADEATAKLIAEKGIWWSLQPFIDDEDSNPQTGENREKQLEMYGGTDNAYALAKKYKVKLAWGTDALFNARNAKRQGARLVAMTRWFKPVEILQMATRNNGELLALSGKRSPYKGKLGVLEEGALADMILVNGDPIQDLQLLADPEKNLSLIIKDGVIYKNTLSQK
ncbi:MAG: amidohydrolase family protein [Chitinophaga sp.]|uniref:metal-dependent hydrolase family protein n=1 Tax=Chitinophaga sp. TaxID=1869181 RepID=UPI001B287768|nr:amidohydrolase family protein [Chitinophaga sp.]MBO9729399.1 amidohydrolase family protein [Chitinophaga sp.]